MQVKIKSFDVGMVVKQKGVELEIHTSDKKTHLGDLVVSMKGLTWCKGKTTPAKGTKVSWKEFAEWAASKSAKPTKRRSDAPPKAERRKSVNPPHRRVPRKLKNHKVVRVRGGQ